MKKYDQLQQFINKKRIHNYILIKKNEHKEIVISTKWGKEKPILTIFPNDDFIIHQMSYFVDHAGAEKPVLISCMPYPVIVVKARDGIRINGFLYQHQEMIFNSSGDCLNPIHEPEDTPEKRKHFNKFMLNWQKMMIAVARINSPIIPESNNFEKYSSLFLRVPTTWVFNKVAEAGWYVDTRDPINAVKNFRKRFQNDLYKEFLAGEHKIIEDFKP